MSNDSAAQLDYEPRTPDLSGQLSPFNFPHMPELSSFELRAFAPERWIDLAVGRPDLIKDYLMFPHEPGVMEAMVAAGAPSSFTDVPRSPIKGLPLKISYWPDSDRYIIQGQNMFGADAQPAEAMIPGAWFYSQLNGEIGDVFSLIADRSSLDSVLEGARILLIPEGASIYHPRLVGISARDDEGTAVSDFWVPRPGQREMWGSPFELRVRNDVRERLVVGDLIKKIFQAALDARAKGLVPAVAFDIDGTLLSTREFAAHIFNEWLHDIYDGPDAEEIRRLAGEREIRETWDSASALRELGITREETIAHAREYFDANFHSSVRRLTMPPIKPMVELLKIFQSMGLGTIYATLRTNVNDELPDGASSAETVFRRLGMWDERTVLLRDEVEDADLFMEVCNTCEEEPLKWDDIIKPYRRAHPGVYIIAVVDNAPHQVNGYRQEFGDSVINIHVAGDTPPHSPPVPEGVFTVRPDQLMMDIEGWREGYFTKGAQHADEFLMRCYAIMKAISSKYHADDIERLERSISRDARSAAEILETASRHGSWHPTSQAFTRSLNETYGTSPAFLGLFENMLEAVNHYGGKRFAVIRGREGMQRIVSIDEGFPHDVEVLSAPSSFEIHPLEVKEAARELGLLPKELAFINVGEHLEQMDYGGLYGALSFGNYPRMEAALAHVAGALSTMRGKPVEDLVAIEQSPHIGLAALICLARLGLKAGWRESSEMRRYQTEFELLRAPHAIRSKISYVPEGDGRKADLAILRRPNERTGLSDMARGVSEGGMLLVQSEHMADYYREQGGGHELLFEMPLHGKDYVLPDPVLASALFFQAWMVK